MMKNSISRNAAALTLALAAGAWLGANARASTVADGEYVLDDVTIDASASETTPQVTAGGNSVSAHDDFDAGYSGTVSTTIARTDWQEKTYYWHWDAGSGSTPAPAPTAHTVTYVIGYAGSSDTSATGNSSATATGSLTSSAGPGGTTPDNGSVSLTGMTATEAGDGGDNISATVRLDLTTSLDMTADNGSASASISHSASASATVTDG
jgi:hypothetical protein